MPSWHALFCGGTARVQRQKLHPAVQGTPALSERVEMHRESGKVTFGFEKFLVIFSQWYEYILECGCKKSLSLRTPLDDALVQLQEVFPCGFLTLS